MTTQVPSTDGLATRLSDSLCARLCHDLSSPLGTLIGALELALEDPGTADEALPLASEAATAMGQRLRLLRAAWAGDCGPLSPIQLKELAAGLPPRITVHLDHLEGDGFPAAIARVLVNLLLLAADALPQGGQIALSGKPDSPILLTVAGPNASWPPGLLAALTNTGQHNLDNPKTVQAPMSAILARAAGLDLTMLLTPGAPNPRAPPLLLSPARPSPRAP